MVGQQQRKGSMSGESSTQTGARLTAIEILDLIQRQSANGGIAKHYDEIVKEISVDILA